MAKQVQVRWPPELWEAVKDEAWRRRMSVSELTRRAVIEHCGIALPINKDNPIEKP